MVPVDKQDNLLTCNAHKLIPLYDLIHLLAPLIGDDNSHTSSSAAWVRGRFSGVYVKPRIFMPYYEEAKVHGVYYLSSCLSLLK